jgi:hypothetical protein
MYIFTLVSDVRKVIERLRKQRGEFYLAMLYNNALEAESGWNLIISAPWTDEAGTASAIHTIARALNEGLGGENRNSISRITVLNTSDPFVRDMTSLYRVADPEGIPVRQVTAGRVTDGSGFIFYSQKVA